MNKIEKRLPSGSRLRVFSCIRTSGSLAPPARPLRCSLPSAIRSECHSEAHRRAAPLPC